MAKFPAMPVWTDALIADTDHLSNAEFGLYFRMLMTTWRTPGCRMPADAVWLERRFRGALELPLIKHEFFESDGNWLTQKRLTKEHNYVSKSVARQSVRAKIRWQKEKDQCRGNAPTPTPTPTPKLAALKQEQQAVDAWQRDPRWGEVYKRIEQTMQSGGPLDGSRIHAWLASGAEPELDIYPTVERLMAKRNGSGPPRSLSYFDRAIADSLATRTRPQPGGIFSQNGDTRHADIRQAFDDFHRWAAPGDGSDCQGTAIVVQPPKGRAGRS